MKTETSLKPLSASNYQEPEKNRSVPNTKFLPKMELKSSIPRPMPYVRSKEPLPSVSSYSGQIQPTCRIPRPIHSAKRGKTSISLQSRASSGPSKHDSPRLLTKHTGARTQSSKPKPEATAASRRNPYSNVRAKIDTKLRTKATMKLQNQFSPTNVHVVKSDVSCEISSKIYSCGEPPARQVPEEDRMFNKDELLEKQRQLLTIFKELKKVQSPDLQPVEREIWQMMQNKTLVQLEGLSRENSLLSSEGAQEFLVTLEIQMQEIASLWLHLICDVISAKMAAGNTSPARIALPDPSANLRDEIFRYLSALPSSIGEPLTIKLQEIEEVEFKVMSKVMHSMVALVKELEDLKDKHLRLEKTQDQIHFELKEEIAILGDENKELDQKYTVSVEKYNQEKAKTEQQEKQKIIINREMVEVKKMIKVMESKCAEYESKVKKAEASCRNLEKTIRNKDIASEKDGKQFRDMVNKYNESKETINELKSELTENNKARISLEVENKDLKNEITSTKAILDENMQKRNDLVEQLTNMSKKLNETEVELNLMKACMASQENDDSQEITSGVLITDLTKDINQKSHQIQDLKKKLNHMEHILKDKTTREDMLMKQVTELQNQPNEMEVTFRTQIKDLHYAVKDLTQEKAELEKIIAQKTLELDQRDLLLQEHSQVLRCRDNIIPMIQSKQRYDEECLGKLRDFVIQHEKTFYNQESDGILTEEHKYTYETLKAMDKYYAVDSKMVDKEMSFRQEKMTELFNLLEQKQMEMMRLERRLTELQGVQEQKDLMVREQEACISSLQKELNERKINKNRGFFSLLTGQDFQAF